MSGLSEIERFIDAFDDPFKGCLTKINKDNKVVRLKKFIYMVEETISHKYMKGLIVRNDNDWIVVAMMKKLLNS